MAKNVMEDNEKKVIQVIIWISSYDLSVDKETQLKEILQNEQFDWDIFFQKIKNENIQSFILNNLIRHYKSDIPTAIFLRANSLLMQLTVKNLSKLRDIKQTLIILNKHKIPCIPWKGPLLAQDLYGSSNLRESVDIDLLVQEKDLIRAKDFLLAANYRPIWKMDEAQEQFYINNTHSYDLITPNGLTLELHKTLARKYYMLNLSLKDLWKRSKTVKFLDLEVNYPQEEDLLLAIAIHHGGRDCWIKYRLLVDWYYLLRRYPNINWDNVLKSAKNLGIRRIICVGTLMCHRLFDLAIPDQINNHIKNKEKQLADSLLKGFFGAQKLEKQSSLVIQLREKLYHKILIPYKIFTAKSLTDIYISTNPVLMFLYRPIRLFNKFVLKKEEEVEKYYSNR